MLNCVAFSVQKQSEEEAAQETTHGNISFDIGRWDWTWRFCVSNKHSTFASWWNFNVLGQVVQSWVKITQG